MEVLSGAAEAINEFDIRVPVAVLVDLWNLRASVDLHFFNDEGLCLFAANDFNNPAWKAGPRDRGLGRSVCRIRGNVPAKGRITVTAAVGSSDPVHVHALERDAVAFTVMDPSTDDGVRSPYPNVWPGVVRPMLQWELETLKESLR